MKLENAKTLNKWKIAFFACLIFSCISLVVCAVSFNKALGVSLSNSYMQEGYQDTEEALDTLIKIINDTDLSKSQIEKKLLENHLIEEWYFDKKEYQQGEIRLNKVVLYFDNEKLVRVDKEW